MWSSVQACVCVFANMLQKECVHHRNTKKDMFLTHSREQVLFTKWTFFTRCAVFVCTALGADLSNSRLDGVALDW